MANAMMPQGNAIGSEFQINTYATLRVSIGIG